MKEIEIIKHRISELYNKADAAELDQLYKVLNQLMADLSVKRAMLGVKEPEEEPEERLEMENKDRLDKEGFGPDVPWTAKL